MNVLSFALLTLQPYRHYLFLVVIHSLTYAGVLTSLPYCIRALTNAASAGSLHDLWYWFPRFALLNLAALISWRLFEWALMRYEPCFKNSITQTIFARLSQQSHHYFQTNFAGALAAKIVDLIHGVPKMVIVVLFNSMLSLTCFSIALIMLSHISYHFALALAIWALMFFIASITIVSRFNYLARISAEAGARVYGAVVDALTNMLGIRLFASSKREARIIAVAQEEYKTASQNRRWFMIKLNTLQAVSFISYQIICAYLLITLYGQGLVTPGDFALILGINLTLVDQLWRLSEDLRELSEHWGMADQALQTFYTKLEVVDAADAHPLRVTQGRIEFDHVQFRYQNSEPLFHNNSIIIPAGQRVGLVGYSGSGKTTFANLILRLFNLSKGRILIDGQDIALCTQDSLHEAIAVVPQDPALFHRSVRENIRYGRPHATDTEIEVAARKAHAHDFITHLSDGYDTNVGERGSQLSGGQRQRIALARALIKNAPILILDEATSQLDSKTEQAIQTTLLDILRAQEHETKQTTLVIAHRLSTLLHMDRILVFDHGQIIQDGTHSELIAHENGLYATLWKTHVGGFLPE